VSSTEKCGAIFRCRSRRPRPSSDGRRQSDHGALDVRHYKRADRSERFTSRWRDGSIVLLFIGYPGTSLLDYPAPHGAACV